MALASVFGAPLLARTTQATRARTIRKGARREALAQTGENSSTGSLTRNITIAKTHGP